VNAKSKGRLELPETDIRDLLKAGLHFGHQTRRWNPRMGRYIWGERDGIHIIDLMQTQKLLDQARDFAVDIAGKGGTILFVGTKKQASDGVKEWADRCGMPYVNQRWLGGLLTNFQTISKRIDRLHELDSLKSEGQLDLLPTKERMSMEAELEKLTYNLGGVRDMERLPQAIVIIDLKTEEIGLREAARLRIPIIGLVDSNVDPVPVDYPIPGNDDAIRSCNMVIGTLGEAISNAAGTYREAEAKRRAEEEARRQREAEEKRRREEEERARKEAEKAAAEAEAAKAEAPKQEAPKPEAPKADAPAEAAPAPAPAKEGS
jgi:small subunit ribosomal protein S2